MKEQLFIVLTLTSLSVHAGDLSLRLSGAYVLGLGNVPYGEDVESENGPSGKAYTGASQGPWSAGLELSRPWGPGLELGAGLFARPWNETRESSQTGSVTRSDKSSISAFATFALAELGWRLPWGEKKPCLLGLGLGGAWLSQFQLHQETIQTTGSSLTHRIRDAAESGSLGPAARLSLSADGWESPKIGVFAGIDAMLASFSLSGAPSDDKTYDQLGNLVSAGQSPGSASVFTSFGMGIQVGLRFNL